MIIIENFLEKRLQSSIDAGFDCPNRDGTVAHGGCTFVLVSFWDAIVALMPLSASNFIRKLTFMHCKWPEVKKYLFIFKLTNNPWKGGSGFGKRYEQAINEPVGVVGITIVTRPDCLLWRNHRIIMSYRTYARIQLNLGLVDYFFEATPDLINRAHLWIVRLNSKTLGGNIHLQDWDCFHLINGLPKRLMRWWSKCPSLKSRTTYCLRI